MKKVPAKKTAKKASGKAPAKKITFARSKPAAEAINQTGEVDAYMKKLKHSLKAEMEAVRSIIMKANSKIAERVKWNAPSFFYKADLAAFNPRATAFVQVIFIFYNGDMVKDDTGLLEGDYKDRRIAKFHSMDDILAKKSALEKFVNQWVALIEK
jgi:hypothetical protein